MSRAKKHRILYAILGLSVFALVFAPLAFPIPVPINEQEECAQYAEKHHRQIFQCGSTIPAWQRTLEDPIAYFTLWLTAFTAVLGAVGLAQIMLAREEFIASHRPRMRVRFVRGPEPDDSGGWEFSAYIANAGESEAVVRKVEFVVNHDVDGEIRVVNIKPAEMVKSAVGVGEGIWIFCTAVNWTEFDSAWHGQLRITGRIIYRDRNGIARITSFARFRDNPSKRWKVSEAFAEDEYED